MYKNKKEVETWFRYLRDLICNEFEKNLKKKQNLKKRNGDEKNYRVEVVKFLFYGMVKSLKRLG